MVIFFFRSSRKSMGACFEMLNVIYEYYFSLKNQEESPKSALACQRRRDFLRQPSLCVLVCLLAMPFKLLNLRL